MLQHGYYEDTVLSKVSQSQKDKYHLHEAIRIVKFIWTELWLLPGLERGVNGKLFGTNTGKNVEL